MSGINSSTYYASSAAFRRALEDRLKREARARDRKLDELRREFLFQRFLALVFSSPDRQWVLKGGASLLMRLTDARFSKDLDLLRLGEISVEEAIAELRVLTKARPGDHLSFVIEDGVTFSQVNPVVEISVTAYIGSTYGNFPIDLARELHLIAAPETVRPTPVVDIPGLSEPPEVIVYPLSDQVADKVCAMYERHGDLATPSSRYRDLVDLALIVTSCPLDAATVTAALDAESARRGMQLPTRFISPGQGWSGGYNATARKTRLDKSLHTLASALDQVGACLNVLLDKSLQQGVWQPGHGWKLQ